jgi:hypothetical protein
LASNNVEFHLKVLSEKIMKTALFWRETHCGLINKYRRSIFSERGREERCNTFLRKDGTYLQTKRGLIPEAGNIKLKQAYVLMFPLVNQAG